MSQIQVRDSNGHAIPNVNVRISDGDLPSDASVLDIVTDKGGQQTWPIPKWPAQRYTLHANVEIVNGGKNDWWNKRYLPASVAVDPRQDGQFDNIVIQLEAAPFIGEESGFLRVQGRDFVTEQGQPWQFRGYSVHYAVNSFWPSSHPMDLEGVFDEMAELDANTMITIGMHASPWKQSNGWTCSPIEHPDYFQKLGLLLDKAEERRIRVAHAPLADIQYYAGDKQYFWRESCAVMRGRWNVIGRKGNESKHNGWYELDYLWPGEHGDNNDVTNVRVDMGGVLCSQGSKGGEENPAYPYLHVCEFEVKRKLPKMFLDIPLRQMMDGDFAGMATNRPTINIEPIFFHDTNPDNVGDRRSTDPRVAREMALMSASCAGTGFGASDALECKRLQPHAREIAKAFFDAMRASFIRPLAALDFQGQQ